MAEAAEKRKKEGAKNGKAMPEKPDFI